MKPVLNFFFYAVTTIMLFWQSSLYAQFPVRELLRGQVTAESIDIDNVTVFNTSSNKGAITDQAGFFTIMAKPTDTLVFSSVAFKSRRLVLNEVDFKVNVIVVALDLMVNELEEVVVTPRSLSGDLIRDNRNLKVTMLKENVESNAVNMQVVDDFYTSPRNIAMPSDGTIPLGMDFVAIGRMIGKGVFGKRDRDRKGNVNAKYYQNRIVPQIIKEKFTYSFFTETLELNHDEIGLFLDFCDKDPKLRTLLEPQKEIHLIEFLIEKNKEYKAQKE